MHEKHFTIEEAQEEVMKKIKMVLFVLISVVSFWLIQGSNAFAEGNSQSPQKKKTIKEIGRDGDRFIAYEDGTVLDTTTGLMWASKDNGEGIVWEDAKKYCETYKGGGYTDWRMPTQEELSAIYEKKKRNKHGAHVNPFIEITAMSVWASEFKDSKAACMIFSYEAKYWTRPSNKGRYRALPVRNTK
jgi:hypothetical protein